MRLTLIGPPGSGKGTQAKLLAERKQLFHFGMGDILREAVRLGTDAGRKAAAFVAKGMLVPDSVVNDIVAERFHRDDRPSQFVMDGYPRTAPQAVAFDQVLAGARLDLDAAVLLKVDDEELVQRLSGRWICPNCHAPYHLINNPPRVSGVCDLCGARLTQREDDREDTVRARLQVYHQTTASLAAHYRQRGLMREVCGCGGIEDIYRNILQAVAAS